MSKNSNLLIENDVYLSELGTIEDLIDDIPIIPIINLSVTFPTPSFATNAQSVSMTIDLFANTKDYLEQFEMSGQSVNVILSIKDIFFYVENAYIMSSDRSMSIGGVMNVSYGLIANSVRQIDL